MTGFLEELSVRRRFGMKPRLDAMRELCARLGRPEREVRAIHVAGTNGKGAVCAMLDSCLRAQGLRTGRYTSPHLVSLAERFFVDGRPVDETALERAAQKVAAAAGEDTTFFEALTAVAFLLFGTEKTDYAILEAGLGGRLDATNVCRPVLCVITRIGLDHCEWLGDTVEKIADEKAGIIKPGVPVVLGANAREVRARVAARARQVGAPFYYAPEIAGRGAIPKGFSLAGTFNRENAATALVALDVLGAGNPEGLLRVEWPGRFQRVGRFLVDGAHNPPAARALATALRTAGVKKGTLSLVAGFCGDKDVDAVLSQLSPFAARGFAVRTNNPRSLSAEATAAKMNAAGIPAVACPSLREALERCRAAKDRSLVAGSLFLAGEALVELGAYPWPCEHFDAAEILKI